MIIEIALGIVLAVIILALLPYIIGGGLVLLGLGLVLAVVAAAIFTTGIVQIIAICIIIFAGIGFYESLHDPEKEAASYRNKQEETTRELGGITGNEVWFQWVLWVGVAIFVVFAAWLQK